MVLSLGNDMISRWMLSNWLIAVRSNDGLSVYLVRELRLGCLSYWFSPSPTYCWVSFPIFWIIYAVCFPYPVSFYPSRLIVIISSECKYYISKFLVKNLFTMSSCIDREEILWSKSLCILHFAHWLLFPNRYLKLVCPPCLTLPTVL